MWIVASEWETESSITVNMADMDERQSLAGQVRCVSGLPGTSRMWHLEDTRCWFCTGFNLTTPVYCQITGSGGTCVFHGVVGLTNRRKKKLEKNCQMSSLSPPQLPSRLPLFFSTFAAERQKEIKGGRHERHAWDCVSRCPVSLLSPLQIWKCWIPNPTGTYDAYSLPQPHLSSFWDSLPSLLPLALTLHHRPLPSGVCASLLQPSGF